MVSLSCLKDKRVRLFEMTYQNLEFEIPAGENGIQTLIFDFPELKTHFQSFLDQSGVEFSQIGGIYPYSARITSFDGNNYFYVRDVEVRVCSSLEASCTMLADGVFYEEAFYGRNQDNIPLAAGEQNVKDLMTGEFFKLEVAINLMGGQITPFNHLSRLDVTFLVAE